MKCAAIAFLALVLPAFAQVSPECEPCHASIWRTYQRSGMARSFARASRTGIPQGVYNHPASQSRFSMLSRDGVPYQRRDLLDGLGPSARIQPESGMEKRIDYVLGSGNHSRAFLSRTKQNTLIELPLAIYAENGGTLALNPGYDRVDHEGFRRTITYDCMFCHNAYPHIPAANEQAFAEPIYPGDLPEGIDCARCHGSGAEHIRLARRSHPDLTSLRAAILNPARLTPDRQMEVCMQCHLETTSFPLPNALQRYERPAFSYNPSEPLSNFLVFFDHAPEAGRGDKFEFVSAAYRLRKSQCFLRSEGKLTCITCHNPHEPAAGQDYNAICVKCHQNLSTSGLPAAISGLPAAGAHPDGRNCVGCHMPRRRTEDVVHAAVADHFIQRKLPPGDPLASLAERRDNYRGKVVHYYPATLSDDKGANDLLLAVAQVIQQSNLSEGITQLRAALDRTPNARAEYYLELAEAFQNDKRPGEALLYYREAVRRDPDLLFGWQKLAAALRRAGQPEESLAALRKAAQINPESSFTWREQGLALQAMGRPREAVAALQKAILIDPDMSEAWNNLGAIRSQSGDPAEAQKAFEEALRIQPELADAHANLATLFSLNGRLPAALEHFKRALELRPADAPTRYGYAMALGRSHLVDEARQQLELSLREDPGFGDSHQLLADLLAAQGQTQAALVHYREAVRLMPDSQSARLGLASALLESGDRAAAVTHLQKAAAGPDRTMRDQAAAMLRQIQR
jgi:tetratricopeptide (TPR) repeat protein